MSSKKVLVAPSLLAADPLRFAEDLSSVEQAGADWHHVDVMDGHFVPNLTYGLPLVRALREFTSIPLDVHIMVTNPDAVATEYVKAGADYLTFPIEAALHSHSLITSIQNMGAKAGIAINPGTALELIRPLLPFVDLVNVMSVNPGFGGQAFIEQAVDRVSVLAAMLKECKRHDDVLIQVDGGITDETGSKVVAAGASVLVAGTYVYKAPNRSEVIRKLASL